MKRGRVCVGIEYHKSINFFGYIWDEVKNMPDMRSFVINM